jgi:hypothetical protein
MPPMPAPCGQLPAQIGRQRTGQHDHAVFAALALAHEDGVLPEVHILHPQLQCFGDAQTGAIQQPRQ